MSSVLNLSSPLLVQYLQCVFFAYKSFPQCVSCGGSKVQPRICWLKKFVHSQFLNCNHMVQYLKVHIFLISFVFFQFLLANFGEWVGCLYLVYISPTPLAAAPTSEQASSQFVVVWIPRKIGQEVPSNHCMLCQDTCSSDSVSFFFSLLCHDKFWPFHEKPVFKENILSQNP